MVKEICEKDRERHRSIEGWFPVMKIYKYKLEPQIRQGLWLNEGATILSVTEQKGEMVMYALVDPKKGELPYDVLILATGEEVPSWINFGAYKFVGTVKMDNGNLMWHVFVR